MCIYLTNLIDVLRHTRQCFSYTTVAKITAGRGFTEPAETYIHPQLLGGRCIVCGLDVTAVALC